MVTVSTSNEAYHHGSLREALVAAGMEALDGPDGKEVSLRELARKVGVSPTAVYRHFPDKQALVEALASEGLAMLGAAQAEAATKVGGGALGFAETGRAYVRFALAHPALFRLMYTQGNPVEHDVSGDPAGRLLQKMTRDLSGNTDDADRLALQAWSIAHGLAMLMLDGRIPADDALIDRLLNTENLFRVQGSKSEESP